MSRSDWAAVSSPLAGLIAWLLIPPVTYASVPFCVAALALGAIGRDGASGRLRWLAVAGFVLGVTSAVFLALYLLFLALAALDVAE